MALHQSTPSHSTTITDRPSCVICGARMWLAKITAEGPYRDKRTFECPICEISEDTCTTTK